MNRIWGWHFGEGLQRVTSDFGVLGGKPSNQKLLDYLASEFVAHNYSMKWLHRLIVTSDTYQLSSKPEPALDHQESEDRCARTPISGISGCSAWKPNRSGMRFITRPDDLDLAVGGKSFQLTVAGSEAEASSCRRTSVTDSRTNRRGMYLVRGYIPSTDVMNNFLTSFDVDDGRTPCPMRTQTVTAPQALFTMNNDLVEKESEKLADVVLKEAVGDVHGAVTSAYRAHAGPQAFRLRTRLRAYLHREGSGAHERTGVAAVQPRRVHLRQVKHGRPS